jgi:hypothetical protein
MGEDDADWIDGDATPVVECEACPTCGLPLEVRLLAEPTVQSLRLMTRWSMCLSCGYKRREGGE